MGRSWRDLGVAPGRIQTARGQRRVVVAVYQVMRRTWMLGLLAELRLQLRRRAQLVAVLLVGWIKGC